MNADKLPWMPFYVRDWLAETRGLPLEAAGALITLLAIQWDREVLPSDEKALAELLGLSTARFKRIWPRIVSRFQAEPRGLQNERLAHYREDATATSKRKSYVGRRGATVRWSDKERSVSNADGIADGNAYSHPDPEPEPESQTDFSESVGNSDSWMRDDVELERKPDRAEQGSRPLPEDWRPSPDTIAAVHRNDCLLDDLITSFRAWAALMGRTSTNWDSAFRKFCKRHQPSDEQRAHAKAADKDLADVVMSGIRDQIARNAGTESVSIDSELRRQEPWTASPVPKADGGHPHEDTLTARVPAGHLDTGEADD